MKILEGTGSGVIRELSYVGGLSMQFWSSLRASSRVLPLIGMRSRWRTAMKQVVAIGTQGLPLIAILSTASDSFSRFRLQPNSGGSELFN